MHVTGFTFVSNAIRLDFPIVPAIRSVLPLCEEVIVNVGPSQDATMELVRSIGDPRIRIIKGTWDRSLGRLMLAAETQRALDAARGDWGLYIQADEVLHESALPALGDGMREAADDARVEGLLVDYVHFFGNFDWQATNRSWYRREVRAVRLGIDARSHNDAQGFRIGETARRIRARRTGARMFHYGWARPVEALRAKREADHAIYHVDSGREIRAQIPERFPWQVGLQRFGGTHPAVAAEWIDARRSISSPGFDAPRWTPRMAQLGVSLAIERLTGWRPFEYRNYVEV
ncbi:MAG: glycosyltransferase [Gemmatimonadota bacterium]